MLLDNSIASFLYNALDSSRSRRRLPPLPQSQPKLSRSNSRQGGLAIRPKALSPSPSVNANLTTAGVTSSCALAGTGSEQGRKIRRISELQILVVCLVYAVYEATAGSLTETLSVLPPYCISSVIAVGKCSFEHHAVSFHPLWLTLLVVLLIPPIIPQEREVVFLDPIT